MMSMILQVGAVPFGFTSELSDTEEQYCDQCHYNDSYFFPSTMSWQNFGNASPLPDLIPEGNTPPPTPHHQGIPHQKFFPLKASSLNQSDYYPLTPSPTPSGRECPGCRTHQNDPFSPTKITDVDSNTRKAQLKLEHIQVVRQRLQQDRQRHLSLQSFCQRQQSLPQLSWELPLPRRVLSQQSEEQSLPGTQRNDSEASVVETSSDSKPAKSADEQVEGGEEINTFEWRRIGGELRLMADTFYLNHSSAFNDRNDRRKVMIIPPCISYAVATSLFFLLSWRLISRYR